MNNFPTPKDVALKLPSYPIEKVANNLQQRLFTYTPIHDELKYYTLLKEYVAQFGWTLLKSSGYKENYTPSTECWRFEPKQ